MPKGVGRSGIEAFTPGLWRPEATKRTTGVPVVGRALDQFGLDARQGKAPRVAALAGGTEVEEGGAVAGHGIAAISTACDRHSGFS